MEPGVAPLRRPRIVTLLAFFAIVAGMSFLVAAGVAMFLGAPPVAATIAIAACLRLTSWWGLLRLKPYGRIAEIISAIAWLPFAYFAWGRFGTAWQLLLPGTLLAIGAIVYLSLPSARTRFAGSALAMSPAAVARWVGIAVFINALLAAVAIPNLLTATGRSPQKQTMADMRTIATAWEARATDVNRYNAAATAFPTSGATLEELTTFLTPTYVKKLPRDDGWGNPWQFGIDQPGGSKEPAQVYTIISTGKDGRRDRSWTLGATHDFDCDIIYSNGVFLQYPEGIQQQ